jgi:hypothetical protein
MRRNVLAVFTTFIVATFSGCHSDSSETECVETDAEVILQKLPPETRAVYEEIKRSPYYHKPTYQDCVVGLSFAPQYPFILSPRRQTDGLTKQLYSLLPAEARETWAYVIPDRIVQNPEKYLSYLAQTTRRKGYIIGTVSGTSSERQCATNEEELLLLTYKLLRSIGYPTKDIRILYSKGDSPTNTATSAIESKKATANKFNEALTKIETGISASPPPEVRITWGADELAMLAFANVLVPMTVSVTASDPGAPQHYEAGESITKIVQEKALDADLTIVDESMNPNIRLVVNSGGTNNSWDPFPSEQNVAYVDRRARANGSQDANWAPTKRCNALAYAGWGTSANAVGSALATAKIVLMSGNQSLQKRLYLEAIAHDIFFIGYSERDKYERMLSEINVQYSYNSNHRIPLEKVAQTFQTMSNMVQQNLRSHFEDTQCFTNYPVKFSPQIHRFFEADTAVEI